MDNELCELVGGLALNKIKDEGDDESLLKNNILLKKSPKTDPAAVEEIVNKQIELLGSNLLYQRINNNFLEHKFDKFFAKEQFKLFNWRQKFFSNKFGIMTFHDVFHITKNFKEVTALVGSTNYIPQNCSFTSKFFAAFGKLFENDRELSSAAKAMFDPRPLSSRSCSLDTNEMQHSGVDFQDVAHMIMALHRIGPCTLLESAMKTVLLYRLPIHDIPKELQQKARQGLYSNDVKDPVPSDLAPLGHRYFCRYRNEYSDDED